MTACGTNLPFRNVHHMAAFGGDPDIEPTSAKDQFEAWSWFDPDYPMKYALITQRCFVKRRCHGTDHVAGQPPESNAPSLPAAGRGAYRTPARCRWRQAEYGQKIGFGSIN